VAVAEKADGDPYLSAEDRARVEIDQKLAASGWLVQPYKAMNLGAGRGVAVREFVLRSPHGRADYLLFLDRKPVGAIEAKPEGTTLTEVELQTAKYGDGLPNGVVPPVMPLPFRYESTGKVTRFTNIKDPDFRSRPLFDGYFHRPETLGRWIDDMIEDPDHPTPRARLQVMSPVDRTRLWGVQPEAIENTEQSMKLGKPRALIQMATGSGKTYTAANLCYRLIKEAKVGRILFLVDRGNLGKQTKTEFYKFDTPGDGRKFTELYNIQHLTSNHIDGVSRVCISTIQRMYSILRGDAQLDEEADLHSSFEDAPSRPVEVSYNPAVPIDTFDVIIVDECHRSIFGVWRQVLEYFDASIVGLTATPNKQAFGFFNQNLVMEYSHDKAVVDGVNVEYIVYRIRTEVTEKGSTIEAGLAAGFRDRQTRKVRWEDLDDDVSYKATDLDRKVVAKDQIRTIIRAFRDRLFTEIFPGRSTVPKTLIFAKDDSHADDIVDIVRDEFGKGNEFCQKITYRTAKDPETILQAFRTDVNPRIVVTVDMIATGTDVKPIECLLFMRDVKSRTYFEQMIGRGVRVMNPADFRSVTPDAARKERFVVVDAIGVTETRFLETTQPLDREPTVPLDKLMHRVSIGVRDTDLASTLAARLSRLDRQLTKEDREQLAAVAGGVDISSIAHRLVAAIDPDEQRAAAQSATGRTDPTDQEVKTAAQAMIASALEPLATNPELRNAIVDARKSYEQTIDETTKDTLMDAGYSTEAREKAHELVQSFRDFIDEHHADIQALQVLYSRPYKERLTHLQVRELATALYSPPRRWTPERLWQAYDTLDHSKVRGSGQRMLTDVVSLVRFALQQDHELVPFRETVNARFESWLAMQEQSRGPFTADQRQWLTWMKDLIAAELDVTPEAFDYNPFLQAGGLGKAHQVFGDQLEPLMVELSQALAA
jgi:type I restriction enzyme, R subunit